MSVLKSETEQKGTDGATLNERSDERDDLAHGIVRLPTGMVAVTRLYCPAGHNLVDENSAARFNRLPGIVLMVEGKNTKGPVTLSPIHSDDTKFGESRFEPGEVTRLTCPTCGAEFPVIQACGCTEGANLVGLYLDDDLHDGDQVVVCSAWGCLRSRILDRFQVISKLE
ncbi:MAG: hypothetical protein GY854_10780 [Deltaproteobacteria bacterium]|nr:hypothetical protein [Deltaproteobacteria bacterium]